MTSPDKRLTDRDYALMRGICPECGEPWQENMKDRGFLRPEWIATLIERDINPATGHKNTCSWNARVQGRAPATSAVPKKEPNCTVCNDTGQFFDDNGPGVWLDCYNSKCPYSRNYKEKP